ncbi:MAG: ABC transporter permease [Acidobacteriota bacterium]
MDLKEVARQGLSNLRTNKLQSILTMCGITWGIAAVMVLAGWGIGLRGMFGEGMTKIGKKIIIVVAGQTGKEFGGYKAGRNIRFTTKDIEAIKASCPSVEYAIPVAHGNFFTKMGIESRSIDTRGVVPEARIVRNFEIAQGRFINQEDIRRNRRFCVLGAEAKERLFKSNDALGEEIRIKGIRFKVVGINKAKGAQMGTLGSLDDEQILVPFTTAKALLTGSRYLWMIQVQPYTEELAKKAEAEVRKALATLHKFPPDDEEAVEIYNMLDNLKIFQRMSTTLSIFMVVVSVVTLLVGGVGVMNIMLVSVAERTREIGLRKAIGAKARDILFQFLAEAGTIVLIGGIVGILLGIGIIYLGQTIPKPSSFFPLPELSPLVLLWATGVMIAIALFSGSLPARRAARLDPVETLHYE